MTMSAFLLLLFKLNLAMARDHPGIAASPPLRQLFGAPIAYAIWFAVPIAGMASLFPPAWLRLRPLRGGCVSSRIRPGPIAVQPAHDRATGRAKRADRHHAGASHCNADTALLLLAAWALAPC